MKARKTVRVYTSPEQKKLLVRVSQTFEIHESKVVPYTFLEYTNHLGILSERVLGRIQRVNAVPS